MTKTFEGTTENARLENGASSSESSLSDDCPSLDTSFHTQ